MTHLQRLEAEAGLAATRANLARVLKAVGHVHGEIRTALTGRDASDQPGLDAALIELTARFDRLELTPERLRFSYIVNGEAWRATLSGCDYYRFFTP